ncbi:MAG: cation:proton antiporter, partial [Pseudomonadota bacterium]
MGDILLLGFLFLVAGVVAVPIATRLGLGSVLGYLLAGVALAPGLSALGVDVIAIQHVAEFGVVMMLFLVGLELEPHLLWQMRARLLGLGGLQVALTTLAVAGVAMALGQNWTTALAVGFILVT